MDFASLDRVFASTHGVFTLPMLEARGHSRRTSRAWIDQGCIRRVCGKGFAVAGGRLTVVQRATAARLTWPDAIICFRTAAAMHGLPISDDGVVHVLVPSLRRPIAGIVPHFWSVRPTEIERRGALALTDRLTTIADCLGRLPNDDAWGALAWMYTRDELRREDVEAQLRDRRHMYGVVRLRQMAGALRRCAVSIPELHLQDFLTEFGFTGWRGNGVLLLGGTVRARGDVVFHVGRLVLEYDGALAHQPSHAPRDAARDVVIRHLGYEVMHIRWAHLHGDRRLLRDTIRALLDDVDHDRRRELAQAWNSGDLAAVRRLLTARRGASGATAPIRQRNRG